MSDIIDWASVQLRLTDSIDPKPCIEETNENIIEWTTKYLIKSYKRDILTHEILKKLVGPRVFELYNSTYPTGIGKHLNCDDVPLLYTILLFPKEGRFVGVTQDYIDNNPVIKNLCNMCPNMCVSNNRYFGRNIVGINNNPLLVVDLPFTSIFVT